LEFHCISNHFADRLCPEPGPAGRAYSVPPDPLGVLQGKGREGGEGKEGGRKDWISKD